MHNLKAHKFTIANRRFESTVAIQRDHISDDKPGIFRPGFSETGHLARTRPGELVFALLASGFATPCYDGRFFFDAGHPQLDTDGNEISVSNLQAGSEAPWYLLDTSRAVKPLIWQERETYDFPSLTSSNDPHVFFNDEYVYGVRARVCNPVCLWQNAGFDLWQPGFGSKDVLNATNYAAARAAMMDNRCGNGRILASIRQCLLSRPHRKMPPCGSSTPGSVMGAAQIPGKALPG